MLTDEEIIQIAADTKTGEPGLHGYILPISFAREIERAVLAKAGEQEPVAVMGNNGRVQAKCEFSDIDSFLKCCRNNTPLYAHPLPAQAIPPHVGIGHLCNSDYARGWNDCVDIMLSASP